MKRIQKIGIYAVCFCLCVACSADILLMIGERTERMGERTPVEVQAVRMLRVHYLTLMFRGKI